MINLSYLITVHNEGTPVVNLLNRLDTFIKGTNDEIIIIDDNSTDITTVDAIKHMVNNHSDGYVKVYQHSLNNDYGSHKNYGNSLCKNEWIFQIDGDECPHEDLLLNIKDIIQENPSIELFYVPRVNDFIGVTDEHAAKWGWHLSPEPSIVHEKIIDTNSNEYIFLKNNGYILEESPM